MTISSLLDAAATIDASSTSSSLKRSRNEDYDADDRLYKRVQLETVESWDRVVSLYKEVAPQFDEFFGTKAFSDINISSKLSLAEFPNVFSADEKHSVQGARPGNAAAIMDAARQLTSSVGNINTDKLDIVANCDRLEELRMSEDFTLLRSGWSMMNGGVYPGESPLDIKVDAIQRLLGFSQQPLVKDSKVPTMVLDEKWDLISKVADGKPLSASETQGLRALSSTHIGVYLAYKHYSKYVTGEYVDRFKGSAGLNYLETKLIEVYESNSLKRTDKE